jgi:hypothetical protein
VSEGKERETVNNQMYSAPMLLVASHDPVHRNFCDVDFMDNFLFAESVKETIKSLLLDSKTWRIAPIFVVYKNDDS